MFCIYSFRSNIIISNNKLSFWKRYRFLISQKRTFYPVNTFLRLSISSLSRNICFIPASNFATVHTTKGWKDIARTGQKKDPNMTEEASLSTEEGTDAVPHLVLLNHLQKCSTVSQQIQTFCSHMSITKDDIERREEFCNSLTELFSPYFPKVKIHQFGSSCNGLGFKGCDIDVSVQTIFDDKEHLKGLKEVPSLQSVSEGITSPETLALLPPNFLLRFVRKILRQHCPDVRQPILFIKARCSILRFYNAKYDVFCDLSYANEPSLRNTRLIRLICHLEERFSTITKFIRYWGKYGGFVGDIDLFNSYSFSLLIVHFLQQTQPPVLPPIKEMVEKSDYLKHGDISDDTLLFEDLKKFEPSRNCQTPEELLREYFFYFLNFDYSNMIMPLTSSIMPKTSFLYEVEADKSNEFEFSTITVQDPFRPSNNTTQAAVFRCCKRFLNGLVLACKAYQDNTLWNPKSDMWGIGSLFHKPMSDNEVLKLCKNNRIHTIQLQSKTDISAIKDILQKGLLFECSEMLISHNFENCQPSLKLHCKVYHNTWQGRDWIRKKQPELLTDPLEIENWVSKEILQNKGEVRKSTVLFTFICEIQKSVCDNELTVVLSFSESKCPPTVSIFLNEFIPSVYNKLVL